MHTHVRTHTHTRSQPHRSVQIENSDSPAPTQTHRSCVSMNSMDCPVPFLSSSWSGLKSASGIYTYIYIYTHIQFICISPVVDLSHSINPAVGSRSLVFLLLASAHLNTPRFAASLRLLVLRPLHTHAESCVSSKWSQNLWYQKQRNFFPIQIWPCD